MVRVDKDEVLVDIGYKSEGASFPSLRPSPSAGRQPEASLGDEIDALVLTKEDAEGRLILSKKRAPFALPPGSTFEMVPRVRYPVNGRVIEVVKGGLILDLGFAGSNPPPSSTSVACRIPTWASARSCARR